MHTERLSLHEGWRRMYRLNRYCRHLSQDELNQRLRDLVLGMLRLNSHAKIGLASMDREAAHAMEIFTHVLEEMQFRHGPYPNGFTRDIFHLTPFPDFAGELAKKAASVLSSRGINSGEVFIKFGKARDMRSLFERGAMRIRPASYYANGDHNGAIRDDELALPLSLSLSREDILRIVLNPHDVPEGSIDQRMDITYKAGTDYWLYCVTTSAEARLFVDFNADACVIIKDQKRFQELISSHGESKFPNVTHRYGRVIYVDPLLPDSASIDVLMSKHFRYTYQGEYRFVWRPTEAVANLPHIDIEIGGLQDFAELVTI